MHVEAGSKPASTYVRWGDISNLVLSLVPYPITTPALRLSNALSGKKVLAYPLEARAAGSSTDLA